MRWWGALSGATDYNYTHFPSKTRQKSQLFCISWCRLINTVPLQCKNWEGGVCVWPFWCSCPFQTDRKKMGDSRGESLTSTVACVTFISLWQTLKGSAGGCGGGQVIKTLKQMCPCVRPSVGAGAFKQLSAEELALALKTSAKTPVLFQAAPPHAQRVEPEPHSEAVMQQKCVWPTPSWVHL